MVYSCSYYEFLDILQFSIKSVRKNFSHNYNDDSNNEIVKGGE